jgi:hypothetical protein
MIVKDLTYKGRHDESEVIEAINLINIDMFCQRYSCLPRRGGLLNQDGLLMEGLTLVANAYGERQAIEEQRQKNASK